jgi:hypothetical protein
MATVFDAPVAAISNKNAFWVGLVWRAAGNTICDITGIFATFFICGFSLYDKSLPYVGKIQVIVKLRRGPDFTNFDPAMVGRVITNKVWFPSIFKIEGNILKNTGLIVFDGEVVMSFTFPDQVISDFILGQQGVGGNFFALNIYIIK